MRVVCFIAAAAFLFCFSGCKSNNNDKNGVPNDKTAAVASIGDETVSYALYTAAFDSYLSYMEQMGYDPVSNEEELQKFRDWVLEYLVKDMVVLYRAKEEGFKLSDEQIAESDAQAETELKEIYDEYMKTAEESNAKDDSKTVQQYFDAAIAELSEYYTGKTMTYDEYCEEYKLELRNTALIEAYKDYVCKDFSVTDADIAHLNRYELQQLRKDGTISAECIALIEDIDAAAEALKELQEAGVPVLWRPLQEASNGWFWWGASGSEAYQWLWHLMYTRMVDYHQLHNLIWIWNGQSAEYLVPDTEYDIAAADIYVDADEAYGSRYEQFFALQKIAKNKMVALSECSTIPDLTAIRRDQAVWSFFGLWYGEYLMDDAAGYTTKQQMIDAYNSDLVLTLSEYQAWYAPKQTTTGEATVQTETTTTTIP